MNPNLRRRTWSVAAPATVLVTLAAGTALWLFYEQLQGGVSVTQAAPTVIAFGAFAVLIAGLTVRVLAVWVVLDGLQIWNMGRLELVRWMHLRLEKEDQARLVLASSERKFVIALGQYMAPTAVREYVLTQLGLSIQPSAPSTPAARRRSFALMGALVISLALGMWMLSRSVPRPVIRPGNPAPDFSATNLVSGAAVSLSRLIDEGRTIVLSFWVVSCEYCAGQLVALDSVQSMAPPGVRVIAVHLSTANVTPATRLVQRLHLKIETWLDVDGEAELRYSVSGTPATVVIDPAGCIEYFVIGTGGIKVDRLNKAIARAASDGLTSACSRQAPAGRSPVYTALR